MSAEEEVFTTAEVVALTGFTEAAISNWVRRGYLTPAGKSGRSNTYALDQVFRAEKTRKRKHRKRGAGC
ncbi:helix-turn-helix domain-containing protein [Streptosporangium sp. KLBMP 9127]|nr:helix-turn-helix domain-containing protein [Streptosporangium sp. KLBMP 9127]